MDRQPRSSRILWKRGLFAALATVSLSLFIQSAKAEDECCSKPAEQCCSSAEKQCCLCSEKQTCSRPECQSCPRPECQTCPRPEDQCARAGYPQCIAKWARPSITPRYSACWVGGGAACKGGPRDLNDGTWGLDYRGCFPPRNIWLKWSHGRKYQGGTGAYRQDSPHIPVVPPLNKI